MLHNFFKNLLPGVLTVFQQLFFLHSSYCNFGLEQFASCYYPVHLQCIIITFFPWLFRNIFIRAFSFDKAVLCITHFHHSQLQTLCQELFVTQYICLRSVGFVFHFRDLSLSHCFLAWLLPLSWSVTTCQHMNTIMLPPDYWVLTSQCIIIHYYYCYTDKFYSYSKLLFVPTTISHYYWHHYTRRLDCWLLSLP